MKKQKAKKIATYIIVPFMVSIFLLDIATVIIGNIFAKKYMPTKETFIYDNGDDRIHFLNTANSDCIILESNGHFAMVDSGEGNSNPRRKTEYKGYEEEVIAYVKKVAKKDDGKAHLDFVLGTHYHYDHVGVYHKLLNDSDIIIDTAYFKEYNPDIDKDYEVTRWGLLESYNQIINDVKARNINLIQNIPEKLTFGDFNLEFYNRSYFDDLINHGENAASIGIKITKGERTAFLAADITKSSGVEQKLIGKIGHCDLLKIGHHGYFGSSSASFLDEITPEVCIATNQQGKIYPNVKWNLTMHAKAPFYATYDYNGIIASFTDDNQIILTNDIH